MLNLKEEPEDNKFLLRTKKGGLKNFKITSSNRVEEAILLATYLYAVGRTDEATRQLESFVLSVEYNLDREDQWDSVGQGILQLAYIHRESGNAEVEQQPLATALECVFARLSWGRHSKGKPTPAALCECPSPWVGSA